MISGLRRKKREGLKVTIEPFRNASDYEVCTEIQREVWRFDDIDLVPAPVLRVTGEYGGILLGAYNKLGEMIGFAASFLGCDEGELIQHSHMLAVRAAYRNFDVGYKLKLAQRKEALLRKIRTIHWTFDPMQPTNAYFNLGKLGAWANVYRENYYGESSSPLHRGLPTDRLLARWQLESRPVRARLEQGPVERDLRKELARCPVVNSLVDVAPGMATCSRLRIGTSAPALLFEVPPNLSEIKGSNLSVAIEWQGKMRQVFRTCFNKGYTATDFWMADDEGRRRAFYVLEKLNAG